MNRCIFNKTWLRDDNLEWLEEVPNDKYMFRCRVCSKNLELGRMGKAALSRHVKSKKHSDLINSTSNSPSFIKLWTSAAKKTSESQPDTEAANSAEPDTNIQNTSEAASPSSSLLNWGITDQIFKSEILWAIQTTVNHNSHQSNRNTSCLFEVMFPDYHVV